MPLPGNSPLQGMTAEDIALLKSEVRQLNAQVETLRTLSFEAHRQAAVWAAAASELIQIIGQDRLKEKGFAMPDPTYMKKFFSLLTDLNKEKDAKATPPQGDD